MEQQSSLRRSTSDRDVQQQQQQQRQQQLEIGCHKLPLNGTKPRNSGDKMITRSSQCLDGSLDSANVLGRRVDIETALIEIRPILQVITPKPLNGSGQFDELRSGSRAASQSCKLCPMKACYCYCRRRRRRQDDSTKLDREGRSTISQLAADNDDDEDDQPNKPQPPSRPYTPIGRSVGSLDGEAAMRRQAKRLFTTKNLNVIFLFIAIYLIKTATAGFFPDSGHEIPCKRGNPVNLLEFVPYGPKLNCYVCKCPDGFVKCEELPGCMHTSSKHDPHTIKNKNKAKPTANHQPPKQAQEHIKIGPSLVYELPNQSGNSMSAQSMSEHHHQIAKMVLGDTTMARREQYLQLLRKSRPDSSNMTTNFQYRQIACASTRQCPGNLVCLPGGLCGCKAKYQREADFCYLRRVTCASRLDCGERENCISSKLIQDYYEKYNSTTNLTTTQQHQLSEILHHVEEHEGVCVCPRGYRLSNSGVSCLDVNECEESHPCAPNALCRNKIGSFECLCPPGFYGDPRTTGCVKYECRSDADCGPQAVCLLVDQVATCLCPAHFMGNAIDLINGCQPFAATNTPPSSTTNAITYATAPVSEMPTPYLSHSCQEDGIKVDIQLGDFEGAVYVLNHSQDPECLTIPERRSGSTASEDAIMELKLYYGDCGLVQEKGEAKLVLVLQREPKLTTFYPAQAHNFTCRYDTADSLPTGELSTTIASTDPAPSAVMLITSQNGSEITSAEEGETLYLRVDIQPNDIYGALAHSCEAQTTSFDSTDTTAVTDSDGCPINSALFSNWRYEEGSKSLVARFNAFKFASSNALSFQCHMRVCFGSGCPTVSCNSIDVLARQRARVQTQPDDEQQLHTGPVTTSASNLFDESVAESFKEGAFKEDLIVKSNTILMVEQRHRFNSNSDPQVDGIKYFCLAWLGIILFILSTLSVTSIMIWFALNYWRTAKRKRTGDVKLTNNNSPLPPHSGLLL